MLQIKERVRADGLAGVLAEVARALVGKDAEIRLAVSCLLARGHLLIEDTPGVGKTTLARALAQALGLSFTRVQFTADLLPADVVGVSLWDAEARAFRFQPGPIFTQCLLADEINRAPARVQSALLEAMQEGQVSCDGRTHALPVPFCVIATQNPQSQVGTFPLPESELDRFLMRLHLGYPHPRAERALLRARVHDVVADVNCVADPAQLLAWQDTAARVFVSDAVLDYVQALLAASRAASWLRHGLSPRAGLGLLRAARAFALIEGRQHVLPDDVQAVAAPVIGHRLHAHAPDGDDIERLLAQVPVP